MREFTYYDDNIKKMVSVPLPEHVMEYIDFLEEAVLSLETALADEKTTKFTTLN